MKAATDNAGKMRKSLGEKRKEVSDHQIAEAYASWEEAGGVKERHLARLAELVPEGGRVLDLGCGTGELVTRHLLERYEVVGVDLSPHSIEVAKREVPGAEYLCADMVQLDLPPASFDVVNMGAVLEHALEPRHVVGQVEAAAGERSRYVRQKDT